MEIVIIMVTEHVKQYTVDLSQDSRFLLFARKKMRAAVCHSAFTSVFHLLSIFKISFQDILPISRIVVVHI